MCCGGVHAYSALTVLQPPRRDPPRRLLHALRFSRPAGQHIVTDRPTPQLLLLPRQHNTDRVHVHLPHGVEGEAAHDVQHEQEVRADDRGAESRRGRCEES